MTLNSNSKLPNSDFKTQFNIDANLKVSATNNAFYFSLRYINNMLIKYFVMEHHWKKSIWPRGTRTRVAGHNQQTCYALDHHDGPDRHDGLEHI